MVSFITGFLKQAGLDHHLDGRSFNRMDTEPPVYAAGPGGSSPSGIPTYSPTGKPYQIKRTKPEEAATIVFGKLAGGSPAHFPALSYTGKRSQIAKGVAKNLDWKGADHHFQGKLTKQNPVRTEPV